jgi:hypothetical protein
MCFFTETLQFPTIFVLIQLIHWHRWVTMKTVLSSPTIANNLANLRKNLNHLKNFTQESVTLWKRNFRSSLSVAGSSMEIGKARIQNIWIKPRSYKQLCTAATQSIIVDVLMEYQNMRCDFHKYLASVSMYGVYLSNPSKHYCLYRCPFLQRISPDFLFMLIVYCTRPYMFPPRLIHNQKGRRCTLYTQSSMHCIVTT